MRYCSMLSRLSNCQLRLCIFDRDVAERIMGLREHIAQEILEELSGMTKANVDVRRR